MEKVSKNTFENMKNKIVDVIADGILYRGVLIGADEKDLYLKSSTRWIVLPMEKVTSIRENNANLSFS